MKFNPQFDTTFIHRNLKRQENKRSAVVEKQARIKRGGETRRTVQGLSLTLQGVDDVHGRDGLAAGVFRVGDRVANDILKEDLENTTGLLVDQTGDTLDTATTGETANGGLGDTLDVIAKDLAVTLGASLSESLSSFSAARHDSSVVVAVVREQEDRQ
jgi:hypothetical protein